MTTGSIGPGTLLGGRYRLDDLLSDADGARFWRGTDTVLGRSIAVHAVPSDDPRAPGLFEAARASAVVTEPHLLRVLDCDDQDGVTWVVNEWGWGTSLDVMLEQGPLPPTRAAWLAREVAETISHAHAQGVAHGHLTPESVLVTEAGAVKLIGFAITAAIEGQSADEARRRELGYGALDPLEADVIDLAGILYAALCARWPGVARSRVREAPHDARGPLRPRQVAAGVPRILDAVCERVLRKEAHEHLLPIETAQEILAALSDHVGDPTTGAPLGAGSMHTEPTVAIRRPVALPATGDPEATQAAAPVRDEPEEQPRSLPPYVAPPERPLFASAERRRTPAGTAPPGGGTPVPVAPLGSEPGLDPEDRSHPWRPVLIAVGALIVIVAMVLAFQLGRGNDHHPAASGDHPTLSPPSSAGAALTPAAVHDFDPEGRPSPRENPQEVPRATDGNPATGWTTLTYASAALGGLKSGVGLLVDLGATTSVGSVALHLTGTPTDLSIYAAPAGVDTPPHQIGGLRKLGSVDAAQADATVRFPSSVRTRFLVVWLTRLPPVAGGFRGQIDELTVRS